MKRKLLSLVLALAMLAGTLPLLAAAGDTVMRETFETLDLSAAANNTIALDGGKLTWKSGNAPVIDSARYGAATNKSLQLGTTGYTDFTPTAGVGEPYTVAMDFCGLGEVNPSAAAVNLFELKDMTLKPIMLKNDSKLYLNGTETLDYVAGHWYHMELYMTALDGQPDMTAGTKLTLKLTDTDTGVEKELTWTASGKNAGTETKFRSTPKTGFGVFYVDNFDMYKGAPDSTRLETPTIAPGTDVENPPVEPTNPPVEPSTDPTTPPVDPTPDPAAPTTIDQQTFESWDLPASGTTKPFTAAENGAYEWNKNFPVALDSADDGTHQNKSLKLDDSAAGAAYLFAKLAQAPGEEYTVAFDFIGTKEDASWSGNIQLIRYDDITKQPLRIGADKIFEANGTDMALTYTPGHWYHAELNVKTPSGANADAVLKLTDATTGQTDSGNFVLQNADTGKQIKISTIAGFGPLYLDNIDIYTGAPDGTRLAAPQVLPGAVPPAPQAKTYVQQTFEAWDFPASGSTMDFAVPADGNYKWAGDVSLDSADNGTVQNKSMKLDGASKDSTLKLELKNPINSDYTVAFDFFGTDQATQGRIFFVNGPAADPRPDPDPNYGAKSGRPVQVDGNQWKYNGNALGLAYQPGQWYHVELQVAYNSAVDDIDVGQKAIVTVTDLQTGESKTSPKFDLKSSMNVANFQFGPVMGGGTRLGATYFDNIDFYLGAPDGTRLAAPEIAPGTTPGVTFIEETFEQWEFPPAGPDGTVPITKAFDHGTYGWGADRPPFIDTADNGASTNNSFGFGFPNGKPLTFFTAAMTNPITAKHTVSFDFYPESAIDGATDQMELFKLNDKRIQALSVSKEGKFMFDNVNQELAYTPGHWYHVDATLDPSAGTTQITLTDTNTKASVTGTVAKDLTGEKTYRFANQTGYGNVYYDNLTIYEGDVKPLGLPTPTLAPGTEPPKVVEPGETVWQEGFEAFNFPETGTSFQLEKGFISWMNGRTPTFDEAWNTRGVNRSVALRELDGGKKITQLNINLNTPILVSHTLAFDWYGEKAAPGGSAAALEIIRLSTGKRPVMISKAGKFQINGVDAMDYKPGRWYHIELYFDMTAGPTATVTITDLTDPANTAEKAFVIADQANNTFFRMANQLGYGTHYVDNIDLYASAPDSTRMGTPPFAPGTQIGQKPGSGDYYMNIADAATTGITIKKNLDSADDRAVVVTALYDNTSGAPTLAAVTSKEVTLSTGETVSLTKEEIVQKPAQGNYSVRYFIWKLGENGETLDVLLAINGE